MKSPLWTKNFTIITLGTVVSMLGNAVSGFAIGLLVLDYSKSIFLYSLFMVVYNLPRVIMPALAGPVLDRFSRRKAIYTLDFISAGIYTLIFIVLSFGFFSYVPFIIVAFFIGTVDSVYIVAYESLYPTLIPEGQYRQAYSVSSMIYPLSAVMVPVAAVCYQTVGIIPLFIFNAVTFLVAALFEIQIKTDESHIKKDAGGYGLKEYVKNFKEGIDYIKSNRGLLVITFFFFFVMFAFGSDTVVMPYFKAVPELGVLSYTYVMGMSVLGRLLGGMMQYKFKYPPAARYKISVFVYIVTAACGGLYLYAPFEAMLVMNLCMGILSVTSYNIRITSTQNYVPDYCRARYNGAFQMITVLGQMVGQLIAGALADYMDGRLVVALFMGINLLAVFLIMIPGGKHVKPIYNQNL